MSDLASTLQRIAAASDLPSLDAERVAALGKSGWVTALLKTLGQMSPEERQTQGPAIQGQRAQVWIFHILVKTAMEQTSQRFFRRQIIDIKRDQFLHDLLRCVIQDG